MVGTSCPRGLPPSVRHTPPQLCLRRPTRPQAHGGQAVLPSRPVHSLRSPCAPTSLPKTPALLLARSVRFLALRRARARPACFSEDPRPTGGTQSKPHARGRTARSPPQHREVFLEGPGPLWSARTRSCAASCPARAPRLIDSAFV